MDKKKRTLPPDTPSPYGDLVARPAPGVRTLSVSMDGVELTARYDTFDHLLDALARLTLEIRELRSNS